MASNAPNWRPRLRDYELQRRRLECPLEECTDKHPLQRIVAVTLEAVSVKHSKKADEQKAAPDPLSSGKEEVVDPLTSLALASSADPLSAVLGDPLSQGARSSFGGSSSKNADEDSMPDVTFEPWSSKRTSILSTYTTSEKIPITTSFLSKEERARLETKAQVAVMTDTVKHRLEQLDDMEEGSIKETLNLNMKDYINKIDAMNQALTSAWQRDQRVAALKIAIQCAKLLVDVDVIHFYPSKFVLITDILDNFGDLVFQRIREKSATTPNPSGKCVSLPENFTPEQVPDSAKETCRNWFFKIASIRELIPRYYVEAAILRCYRFLTDKEFSQALVRLSKMIRGIGDPLVSTYARAYMCRVGQRVAPNSRVHLMLNFTDYLGTYNQLNTDQVQNALAVQRLDMAHYMHLYVPGVEWILQCVAHKAPERVLEELLEMVKSKTSSALVLNAIINSFKPDFISSRALGFAEMIKDSDETALPKHKLYVSLGNCVVMVDPPTKDRLPLLNSVWKAVMKLTNPKEYIVCAQVWIEFVAKSFSRKEVNTLLDDIIKHITPDRAFEAHYAELIAVVHKILPYFSDYSTLFAMDKFLPYVDLFQKENVKVEVCSGIVRSFVMKQEEPTCDPLIINAVMYLCKVMHDSISAMSLDDDRRQISDLICSFLRKISFGRDFEQQLSFYVEARATFTSLDAVMVYLVHSVNWLAMRTRELVKGNHSRKTASFVRACAAYCFITIPSLDSIVQKLKLYLITGRVAVANGALSQGDAFFRAAINSLKDVAQYMDMDRMRQSTESLMAAYVNNMLSTLLVVPDNPDRETLQLIKGLLNTLVEYQWLENSEHKFRVYVNSISLLSTACQDIYPYSVDKVDSNDSLYAGDQKFVAGITQLVGTLLLLVLKQIKEMQNHQQQGQLAVELFSKLACHADISDPSMAETLLYLWNLAQQQGVGPSKLSQYLSLVTVQKDPQCQALASKLSLTTFAV